jgi:hypothetical protein
MHCGRNTQFLKVKAGGTVHEVLGFKRLTSSSGLRPACVRLITSRLTDTGGPLRQSHCPLPEFTRTFTSPSHLPAEDVVKCPDRLPPPPPPNTPPPTTAD